MPSKDDRTPGLANALFGPRLGRPVFVAARTSTPLPMSVTDPATNLSQGQFFSRPIFLKANFSQGLAISMGPAGFGPPASGALFEANGSAGRQIAAAPGRARPVT